MRMGSGEGGHGGCLWISVFGLKITNSTPIIVTIVLTVLAMLGFLDSPGLCASPARQEEVATKGAKVMPFDLAQTMHHFRAPRE